MHLFIRNLTSVFILITIVIGFVQYRKLKRYEHLIVIIPILNFAVDMVSDILAIRQISTNFCYNTLVPVEISLTLFIYFQNLRNDLTRKVIVGAMFIYGLFSFVNLLVIQDYFMEFGSYNLFFGGILVCVFSYLVWKEEILFGTISLNKMVLWFAAANFVYYTISVPVLSANNWLVFYFREMASPIFLINLISYLIWSVILSIGLLWKSRRII